ncbi:HNH endonuclease signature motif containing protein [Euzebya tangerina]|uniref:HNH endonuclease signature motif containing protein n=1 Tax=Euzebya tangerina TaxID=591198 RepID=UPI0013C2EC43|nr:HNH endonuclease signature motif containing protein [Euzebya tangerina]
MTQRALSGRQVHDLVADLRRQLRHLEPSLVADDDVTPVVEQLAAGKKLLEGALTLMARRVEEVGRESGRSQNEVAGVLAKVTGRSRAAAKRQLKDSERLANQPDVANAVRDGQLSDEQTSAVSQAAEVDPSAAGDLLDAARSQSLGDLQSTCRERARRADPNPDQTRRRHYLRRSFRSSSHIDGEWQAFMSAPADIGARIEAALRRDHDRIFKSAYRAGRREDDAAYRLDALLAVTERGAACAGDSAGSGHVRAGPRAVASPPETTPAQRSTPARPSTPAGELTTARQSTPSQESTPARSSTPAEHSAPARTCTPAQESAPGQRSAPAGESTAARRSSSGPDVTSAQEATSAHETAPEPEPASIPGATAPDQRASPDQMSAGVRRPADEGGPPRSAPGSQAEEQVPQDPGRAPHGGCTPARRSARQAKVIVRVDASALRRGWATADEVCEIAGIGRVSLSAVKQQIPEAHVAYVIQDAEDVAVAHLGRQVTARQRTAMEARGYQCEVPHCTSDHLLEIDHVTGWAINRTTQLDDLAWLCSFHHSQKTDRGYHLRGSPGARRWVDQAGQPIVGAARSADPTRHASRAGPMPLPI